MDGPVAIVELMRGRANALDTGMCQTVAARFTEIGGAGARAVVLTGHGTIFSAGVDLIRLAEGGPGYVAEFLPALSASFLAVLNCPIPVVAAVNGHAVAGGCIFAAACDWRVMNAGHGRIGVTELLVGVPFPVAAMEIMRFAVGTRRLVELTSFGRTYPAADAIALGLIDEAVPGPAVLDRAVEVASQLAELPAEALRQVRQQIREPVLERMARQSPADDAVAAIWAAPATQDAVRQYVGRILHR
jgi:enoyl-CoA hydratase